MLDHKVFLFCLPAYSPELNKVEIIWWRLKYRCRFFVAKTEDTIDAELVDLLAGYRIKLQTDFSRTFTLHVVKCEAA